MSLTPAEAAAGAGATAADSSEDDLRQVKALAEKLHLQTRRPSFAEWRQKLQLQPWKESGEPVRKPGAEAGGETGPTPAQRAGAKLDVSHHHVCGFANIGEALGWREMQSLDHQLARKLICLRREIHRLKVEQVCHQHKEMLDDVTYGLEECEEESDLLCDIPLKAAFSLSTPLKHIGVTKMNINSRRFSLS
ncbi:protein FAM167A isoform X2 [Narcine bancroftii]|uniref:protein FAM167A isoform X2 n=1 Tax=Narcine bancroftii TaxID=1343680 RepID=UPI00383120F4